MRDWRETPSRGPHNGITEEPGELCVRAHMKASLSDPDGFSHQILTVSPLARRPLPLVADRAEKKNTYDSVLPISSSTKAQSEWTTSSLLSRQAISRSRRLPTAKGRRKPVHPARRSATAKRGKSALERASPAG